MNNYFSHNCNTPDEYENKTNDETLKDNLLDSSASFNGNLENVTDIDDCYTSISQQPINPLYSEKSSIQKISLPNQKLVEDDRFWREIPRPVGNSNKKSQKMSKSQNLEILKQQEDSVISSSSVGTFSANKDPKNRFPDEIDSWTVATDGKNLIITGFSKQCGKHVSKIYYRRLSNNIFYDTDGIPCAVVGQMIENRSLPMYVHYKFSMGIPDDWQEIIIAWNKYMNQNCPSDFRWPALKPLAMSPPNATDSDWSSVKLNNNRTYTSFELSRKIKKMQKLLRTLKFQESMASKMANSRNDSVSNLVRDLRIDNSSRNGVIDRDSPHWLNQNRRFDMLSSSNKIDGEIRPEAQNNNPNRLFFNNNGFGVTSFHKKSSTDILNQIDSREKQNSFKPIQDSSESSDFSFDLESSDYIFSRVGTKAKETNEKLISTEQNKNSIVCAEETDKEINKNESVRKKPISRKLDFDSDDSTGSKIDNVASKNDSIVDKRMNLDQNSDIFTKPVTTKKTKKTQNSNITKVSKNRKTPTKTTITDISSSTNLSKTTDAESMSSKNAERELKNLSSRSNLSKTTDAESMSSKNAERELKNLSSRLFSQSVLSDSSMNVSSSFISSRGRRRVPALQYWQGHRMAAYKETIFIEQSTTIRQDLDDYVKTNNFDTSQLKNSFVKLKDVSSSADYKKPKARTTITVFQQKITKKQNTINVTNKTDEEPQKSPKKSIRKHSPIKKQSLLPSETEQLVDNVKTSVKSSSTTKIIKNSSPRQLINSSDVKQTSVKKQKATKQQVSKELENTSNKIEKPINQVSINTSISESSQIKNKPLKQLTKDADIDSIEINTSIKKPSLRRSLRKQSSFKNKITQLTEHVEIYSNKIETPVGTSPGRKINKLAEAKTKLISKRSTLEGENSKKSVSKKSTKKQMFEVEETVEDMEREQLKSNSREKNILIRSNSTPTPKNESKKRKIVESSNEKHLNKNTNVIETPRRYSTRPRKEINYNEKKSMHCWLEDITDKLDESNRKSIFNKSEEKNTTSDVIVSSNSTKKTKTNKETVDTSKINHSATKNKILEPAVILSPVDKYLIANKENENELKKSYMLNLNLKNIKKVANNFKLPKPKKQKKIKLPTDPREMSMLIKQTKQKTNKNSKSKEENHSETILMSKSISQQKRKLFSGSDWTHSDKFNELIVQNLREPVQKPNYVVKFEQSYCPLDFDDKFSEVSGLCTI